MDAGRQARELCADEWREADGEVVWFWRPLAGAKLARMLCIAPMTVTKTSWTPGRARRKPLKPSRRKCRIVFGEPVVTTLVCFFSFAREAAGASGIRHFLRPLFFEGHVDGTTRAQLCGENVDVCPGRSAARKWCAADPGSILVFGACVGPGSAAHYFRRRAAA